MAEQLNNHKVKMGVALPVKNLKAKPTQNDKYYAVKFQNQEGKDQFWALFTTKELYSRPKFLCGQWKQDMKLGRLYKFTSIYQKNNFYLVKLNLFQDDKDIGTVQIVTRLNQRLLKKGRLRAQKNTEDIPKQSFIQDMLD